jgi:anthranilate synthase component 1
MTEAQFTRFAKDGYNRIPIQREILADLDTPLSAYLKLTGDAPFSYILESVQGFETWGRYSIIGLPAETLIQIQGYQVTVRQNQTLKEQQIVLDPFAWLTTFLEQRFKVPPIAELPTFTGGLVGYFGYDTVRYIEPRLKTCQLKDPLQTPDILLLVSDNLVIFDNFKNKLHLIVHANPEQENAFAQANRKLENIIKHLRHNNLKGARSSQINPSLITTNEPSFRTNPLGEADFTSGFPQTAFEEGVSRIKSYIQEGDAMQVVLSQRLEISIETTKPVDIYRALRFLNPSPYLYYLNLKDFYIVGSSPEILVRKQGQQVTVRPIAGTRPRGRDEAQDAALAQELLADPKELAEHVMLIDLGRNDVGRVAKVGTVQITEKMNIERYSHVMHIVSNVIGQLNSSIDALAVLKATLPAGTLSGAPKIRAMEIIDELEPIKRGIYGGAVGYLTWQGDINTAIAIRTAIIKDHKLSIQVGAGIVADSCPTNEWLETMNKGRAVFKAVEMAYQGL